MAYFVVERSGDEGVLGIPLPRAYETREAAIAALSAATASGEVVLAGEVFIADLATAVPVLVMQAAAPIAPAGASVEDREALPEAIVDAAVAEAEDAAVLDEVDADVAYTSWEPLEEIAAADVSLADALKRAATSLEDEGIVAPDSIDSAREPDEAVDSADEAESEAVDDDSALLAAVGIGEPPIESADAGEPRDKESWPWANVESYEIKAGTLEAEDAVESLGAVAVAEPASVTLDADAGSEGEDIADADVEEIPVETSPIITSAPPEGEDAYLPHPVILGDYGESEPAAEFETPEDSEIEPEGSEEPEAVAMPEEPDEPAVETEGDESPSLDDILDSITHADPSTQVIEAVYEPAGDLDLAGYTCPDCVYSNTCPKVGQTTPAECGSFQWKSE